MRRILVTGASGIVGKAIRPFLAENHGSVVLTDLIDLPANSPPLHQHEKFVKGDITDFEFVKSVIGDEIEGILHLAGMVGPDYTFDEVLGPNIVGTRHIFAAAHAHKVKRVIYASSHHAIGFFTRDDAPLDESTPPRPDSFYGISKAFGEAIGSYYADKFGMEVLAIRIGFVGETVVDERRLHTWISPRDLAQLVEIGFTAPDLGFQVVYGVSDNPDPFFSNENARRLGYAPRDRALDHLAEESLSTAVPDTASGEGIYLGGHFADRKRDAG